MRKIHAIRVDQVAITHIDINPTEPTSTMSVDIALMDSKLGQTIAVSRSAEGWSTKTREALTALIACMEEDVAAALQEGGEAPLVNDSTGTEGGLF